jgi:hypothetical protein
MSPAGFEEFPFYGPLKVYAFDSPAMVFKRPIWVDVLGQIARRFV